GLLSSRAMQSRRRSSAVNSKASACVERQKSSDACMWHGLLVARSVRVSEGSSQRLPAAVPRTLSSRPPAWSERAMVDQDLTQRAFTTILEHFVATGRAPHYAELADALHIGSEEGREVLRATVEATPIASCWLPHAPDSFDAW